MPVTSRKIHFHFLSLSQLLFGAAFCHAADLDREFIQKKYLNGDLDTVLLVLEPFQKSNLKWTREDSVFALKHLGMVFSA